MLILAIYCLFLCLLFLAPSSTIATKSMISIPVTPLTPLNPLPPSTLKVPNSPEMLMITPTKAILPSDSNKAGGGGVGPITSNNMTSKTPLVAETKDKPRMGEDNTLINEINDTKSKQVELNNINGVKVDVVEVVGTKENKEYKSVLSVPIIPPSSSTNDSKVINTTLSPGVVNTSLSPVTLLPDIKITATDKTLTEKQKSTEDLRANVDKLLTKNNSAALLSLSLSPQKSTEVLKGNIQQLMVDNNQVEDPSIRTLRARVKKLEEQL